ncbi:MFS transporter [Oceanicella sp. SM1341]|uniref:MFS transporter n=1 Tax=Oceanicella sp. SM1341 TaxID=1548889 RepID=UPI000E4DE1BF|nr:MFS transporter [Oceanicella sp. SM1341]
MLKVLRDLWPLLGGLMLLMLGNGMQGTLLGVRGALEGFGALELSFIMSAYFLGYLFSARLTPRVIAKVGHVRVFAAYASLISACFVLYAAIPDPIAWFVMRVAVGFCYCGVYVVVESWLNDSTSNETRGQALSAYIIVQIIGIIAAQVIMNFGEAEGYILFVVISVLVSVSFLPILLTVSPAPVFHTARPMSLLQLYRASPLGIVAAFLLGSFFSSIFGMGAVYGSAQGLSVQQITIFVGAIYAGSLVVQYPLGWLSDRMDRRQLIMYACGISALGGLFGIWAGSSYILILVAGAVMGGLGSPLWSLVVAHTNDYLDHQDMASASGGLLFVNGVGAVGGAPVLGWLMETFGAWMFFAFNGVLMALISLYALYRMTQRAATPVEETVPYAPVLPTASPVAHEVASEVAQAAHEEEESGQAA